jgi:hypothetical protein
MSGKIDSVRISESEKRSFWLALEMKMIIELPGTRVGVEGKVSPKVARPGLRPKIDQTYADRPWRRMRDLNPR